MTPPFVRDQLHAAENAYSLLWALFAIGALVSLRLCPLFARRRPGMVNALGALLWGLVMLPLIGTDDVRVAALLFLISGAIWGPYTAVEATALHRWTAASEHGRVFGVQRSLLARAVPLGAAVGALALERHDAAAILWVSALACTCAARGTREPRSPSSALRERIFAERRTAREAVSPSPWGLEGRR